VAHPERHIWRELKNNPLDQKAIIKLARDGWKINLVRGDMGKCSNKSKEIEIPGSFNGYVRDATLFHEIVHAWYGKETDDSLFQSMTLMGQGRENYAITDWLARLLRADYKLLRTAINTFDLVPYVYDKPSYLAFAENPIDFNKQYMLPWGIKTKIRFSSTLMHYV
jgi:hypothetical protein